MAGRSPWNKKTGNPTRFGSHTGSGGGTVYHQYTPGMGRTYMQPEEAQHWGPFSGMDRFRRMAGGSRGHQAFRRY